MNKSKLFCTLLLMFSMLNGFSQVTPVSQMEKLNRGLVAVTAETGSGNFVSWRFLGTDDEDNTRFDLIRNGTVLVSNLYATNYRDAGGNANSEYQVVTKVNGEVVDTSEPVKAWGNLYKSIKLDRPQGGTLSGEAYTYSPNDMSVGDVDGDGEYELFVKWDPSNAKDNSQGGVTGKVYIDCYKLDGTKLWRVDLGGNIRAGAHYTQFMVYDFDGDGLAEMMCKTAPNTSDGTGQYVNQVATDETIKSASNTKSWRSGDGRITGGQEWLTVFEGKTGRAIHTVFYNPNRNQGYGGEADGSFNWGAPDGKNDAGSYGNRGERYLAAVAYLDGPDHNASGIFCRGYYGYAFVWAVDFDGKEIRQRWLHNSDSRTTYKLTTFDADGNGSTQSFSGLRAINGSGSGTMFANGNHNMSIADVDGDGCDEIIWGSAALNNDGKLLYATGFGHGDAIHVSDLDPTRPGLEVFQVHEEKGTYAWDVHDAATGEILYKGGPAGVDNGRGMAAQLDANHYGFYFSSASAREQRSAVTGEVMSEGQTSLNFRIYWDGDLQDELLDGTKIEKWNGNGTTRIYINGKNPYDYNSSSSCNGTKSTPNLQADILGDWREEIILWSTTDNATLNIFTTNTPTKYRIPTLMHDHVYRMGICWQNTAYNQPPHLGYYLPDAVLPQLQNDKKEISLGLGDAFEYTSGGRYTSNLSLEASYTPDDTKIAYGVPAGMEQTYDDEFNPTVITIKGTPQELGDYHFAIALVGLGNEARTDTVVVHVQETSGIENVKANDGKTTIYTMAGHRLPATSIDQLGQGVYIIRKGDKTYKVSK